MKRIIVLFALVPSILFGQYSEKELKKILENSSPGQLLRENSEMLLQENYHQSVIVINQLLENDSENANYNYRKGYALLKYKSDYTEALPHLEKAAKNVKKVYDASSEKETAAPIDAYYWLAKGYHLAERIDLAKEFYKKFLESTTKKNALFPWAELGLQQCAVAEREIRAPKNYQLKNVGPSVNTHHPEYAPVISLDGTALYFTSRRLWADSSNARLKDPVINQYWEDIYVSYRDFDGDWQDPIMLEFCSSGQNEATVSVSADERKVFVYNDRTGGGDIYFSQFETGKFDYVEELKIKNLNTNSWEPHLTMTPDGQTVYFVSDREGGYGGRDIYRMVKLPDGSWSLPINLGPEINSEFDEDSPFMAVDNKTLYFASNGRNSMGGFDIFMTVRDEFDNWTTPMNLGYPLNSTGDDIFYTTTADGFTGYLTSFRIGGHGDKDIYEIKNNFLGVGNVSVLKGEIVVAGDMDLPEDIAIRINCLNCGEVNTRIVYPRMRDGVYFSALDKCREYELVYTHNNGEIEFHREKITTNCDTEYEEIYKRVLLRLDNMTIIPFMKYTLAGKIRDRESGNLMAGATVEFIAKNNNEVFEKYTTDANGAFKSNYLSNKFFGDEVSFLVRVSFDEYLTQVFEATFKLGENSHIELEYKIDKPDLGKDLAEILQLSPIYFDLDKWDIRPDAEVELAKIIQIMNENPKIKIELGSHTDCRGSASYNMTLSDRRAKSSAQYIRSRISEPNRIYGKGYGESQLVNHCECEGNTVVDCSEEEHQANRRTEFRIIK
jgi:outer membrane protein OmpA-like peptidoglycan-associated protein/tetratricopeptide (TPR) repeat protein